MLNCTGANYGLYRTFQTKDVIHLRYDNSKIRLYLQSVVDQYDRTLDAVNAMIRLSNQPKYKLKIDGNMNFREKKRMGQIVKLQETSIRQKLKGYWNLMNYRFCQRLTELRWKVLLSDECKSRGTGKDCTDNQ